MTSRQDLLEAQAYVRRRVLAGLLAGECRSPEPAPSPTGRSLLGGLLVAVVVVCVAAVVALLG